MSWPSTDEEREAFRNWQYEVANGDTTLGFDDWGKDQGLQLTPQEATPVVVNVAEVLADFDRFDAECEAAGYTDTGDAWQHLNRMADTLRSLRSLHIVAIAYDRSVSAIARTDVAELRSALIDNHGDPESTYPEGIEEVCEQIETETGYRLSYDTQEVVA